jgi:predicted MFS family arabinose efflux permease
MLLVYIKMGAAGFYFTSEMSLMPKILNQSQLKLANEIHSIVWSVCFTVGVALGGLAVEFMGIKAAFLIDASLFVLAIFIFSALEINIEIGKATGNYLDSFKAGLYYVFRQKPKLLLIIGLHASVGLTVFDSIVTMLAKQQYRSVISVALAIGFIGAIRSAALVIGPFLFSRIINKESLSWIFLAQGAAIMLWGALSYDFWLSLVGAFCCGLFTTTIWSFTMTMLQEAIDHEYYGRVVSINDMFFTMSACTTSLALGVMMEYGVTPGNTLLILGFAFIFIGIVYKMARRRLALVSQR